MSAKTAKIITCICRSFSTKPLTNNNIVPYVYNRNPRNLEKLRIERKPTGYSLEKAFVEFWHKLEIIPRQKYVIARLIHNSKKVVVEASTNEWGIYKHLYCKTDKVAYITLAKIFAERCMESGIYSFASEIMPNKEINSKVQIFLQILEEENLSLTEMPRFDINSIWYLKREKKPWTVLESQDS